MTIIFVLGIVMIPLAMSGTHLRWHWLRPIYDVVAIISAIVSFSTASITIYSVIKTNTVFMTTIHALFVDPYFLIPSAYLGFYVIYLLYNAVWGQFKQ